MYFIFVGMSFYKRTQRANVLPFTLGPYGSNFTDVVNAIRGSLSSLDRSIKIETSFGKVTLLTFLLAFIGNMP